MDSWQEINALDKLPWLPSFFIFLLFLAIETAPIIAKLLSPKGIYDIRVQDEGGIRNLLDSSKATQRNILSATDAIINDKIYEDITQEEELYNYKRKKARELLQIQADAFYNQQRKPYQKTKIKHALRMLIFRNL